MTIGERIRLLTELKGYPDCNRCKAVARRIDAEEKSTPGWAMVPKNRDWIIKKMTANAVWLAGEHPDLEEDINKNLSRIDLVVDLAIVSGAKYDAVVAAMKTVKFVRNVGERVVKATSGGCGGC